MCASPAERGRVSPSPSLFPRAFSRVCNVASLPAHQHTPSFAHCASAPQTLLRRCQPSPPRACATFSLRLCRPPAIKPVLRPRAHASPDARPDACPIRINLICVQGVCCTVYVCTCSEHACSGRSGRVHGVSKARARSVQACTSDQSCAPMPTSFAVVGKPTCAGRWAGGHARMKRMKPPISMCLVVVARCRDRV